MILIRENTCFNNNHNISSFAQEINSALDSKGFRNNRFATVGYDGSIDKPFIYSARGQVWNTAEDTAINARM